MTKRPADVDRRQFLRVGSGAVAAGALVSACRERASAETKRQTDPAGDKWARIRAMFDLEPSYAHFGGFLLSSHPRPVREAIEYYRKRLDTNPVLAIDELLPERNRAVRAAAARFLGGQPHEVALTDSTTMGLGLVYGGLRLREGEHVVTTEYDHYSTHEALRFRAMRDGATFRRVALFDHSAKARETEVVKRLMAAVTDRTRLVAVTWVHSMSGVRMPVSAIAAAIAERNRGRDEADRTLLSVDGVHGFGAIPISVQNFGADMFIAGTHKWLFGPRGTGLAWARSSVWKNIVPTVPPFEEETYRPWLEGRFADHVPGGILHSPGGFHTFEHRWALPAAFDFQDAIGRDAIAQRIHALNRQLKEGLAKMPKVELFTPMADELSAGITCFLVQGRSPYEVVKRLLQKRIIATTTPYANTYARLAPGLLNTPAEVDRALAEIRALA